MLFNRLSIQWKITLLAGICLLAIVAVLVSASVVQADRNAFLAAGWSNGSTLDYASFSGGHEIPTAQFPAIWQFFCPFQRLPD